MTEKRTITDEFGRKVQTQHFKDGNVLDYQNDYRYATDKATTPLAGEQTYFYAPEQGKPQHVASKESFVYDESKKGFRTTKKKWYDKETGRATLGVIYDKNEEKIAEERYTYENGFILIHRKDLESGKVAKEGDFVLLAGERVRRGDPLVEDILKNFKRIAENAQKKEAPKKPIAQVAGWLKSALGR